MPAYEIQSNLPYDVIHVTVSVTDPRKSRKHPHFWTHQTRLTYMYLLCHPGTQLMHEKIRVNWKPSGLDFWFSIRTQDPSIIPAAGLAIVIIILQLLVSSTVLNINDSLHASRPVFNPSSLSRWLIGYLTRAHIILSIITNLHCIPIPTHTHSRAERFMYVCITWNWKQK